MTTLSPWRFYVSSRLVSSRLVSSRLVSSLVAACFLVSCAEVAESNQPPEVNVTTGSLLSTGYASKRLSVLAFNVHIGNNVLLDKAGGILNPFAGQNGELECKSIVSAVVQAEQRGEKYDVLALQEVWDEPGRRCLVKDLYSLFPYHAGAEIGEQALLVLSKLPFEKLPIPSASADAGLYYSTNGGTPPSSDYFGTFLARDVNKGGAAAYRNTLTYDDAAFPDSLAGKGMMHVRVKRGEVNYDLMLTHAQSDTGEGATLQDVVRDKQMAQVGRYVKDHLPQHTGLGDRNAIVFMGDMNAQGLTTALGGCSIAASCPTMAASEYGKGIRSRLGDLDGFYDAWWTTSPFDLGVSFVPEKLQRLDYFLIDGTGFAETTPLASAARNAKSLFPQWVRTTMAAVGSDHNAIALDIGPSSPNASPATAQTITSFPYTPDVLFETPGSNSWFYLPKEGSYSIGIPRTAAIAGLRADVFAEDDLGRRLGPSPMFRTRTEFIGTCLKPVDECLLDIKTYSGGSKKLYVRVYDPNGSTTGRSLVKFQLHDCSSPELACEPKPGGMPQLINRSPAGGAANATRRESYFVMRTVPAANGSNQNATFLFQDSLVGGGTISDNFTLTLTRRLGGLGGWPTTTLLDLNYFQPNRTLSLRGDEYVEVKVVPSRPGLTYALGWNTDLTWLTDRDGRTVDAINTTSRLDAYCADESGGDGLGSDEVSMTVAADGVEIGFSYRNDLDASESIAPIVVSRRGFRSNARFTAKEYVGGFGGTVDNMGEAIIPTLSPTVADRRYQTAIVQADGLQLRVHYGLSHGVLP